MLARLELCPAQWCRLWALLLSRQGPRQPACPAALPQIQGWFDLEGIRAAFTAADFVGISA